MELGRSSPLDEGMCLAVSSVKLTSAKYNLRFGEKLIKVQFLKYLQLVQFRQLVQLW